MIITLGSTNNSVYFYIVQDASATSPGEPATGLIFSDIETGGSASYVREGGARVDLTLVTLASADAAHADGGFILVDDINMPGLYRCDYPDVAFISGVEQTLCQIVVASSNNAVAAPVIVDIRPDLASSISLLDEGIIYGTAVTGNLSTTQITSSLTGYDDNQLLGRIVTITSGGSDGEQRVITGYTSSSGLITFNALTIAPANLDTFKIT